MHSYSTEWKCWTSSSKMYAGVRSVPPPNHHCLGAPGVSAIIEMNNKQCATHSAAFCKAQNDLKYRHAFKFSMSQPEWNCQSASLKWVNKRIT